jgi:hypothetical protein
MPVNELYAVELHELADGDSKIAQVDCRPGLRSGVTISNVISCASLAVPSPAVALTISGADRNSSQMTVNGLTVPANNGIVFTVSGGTAGIEYTVKTRCTLSTGEVVSFFCRINKLSI